MPGLSRLRTSVCP